MSSSGLNGFFYFGIYHKKTVHNISIECVFDFLVIFGLINKWHIFEEFIDGFLIVLTELKCPMVDVFDDSFMFFSVGGPIHRKEFIDEFDKLFFKYKRVFFDKVLNKFINFLLNDFDIFCMKFSFVETQ